MGTLLSRTDQVKKEVDKIVLEHQKVAIYEVASLILQTGILSRQTIADIAGGIDDLPDPGEYSKLPVYSRDIRTHASRSLRGILFNTEYLDED